MRVPRWLIPQTTRAQKVALVTCALAGVSAGQLWLHLGRPSWPITRWGIPAGLGVVLLGTLTAPPGARLRRLGVWTGCVYAADWAVLTTTAVAAAERGEGQPGHLAGRAVSLLLTLSPLAVPTGYRPGSPAVPAGTTAERVRRLSGNDSLFVCAELPEQPMTVGTLWLLRPRVGADSAPVPLTAEALRRHVADRLGALPAFRRRVMHVPFGLGRPVYVEDPAFDITHHVVEHVLAGPGTAAELDAFYAEQAGLLLDSRRPQWRMVLVHGLADGRQAVILTVHHCVLDGFALMGTMRILLGDLGPDAASVPTPEPTPSAGRLLVDGLVHQAHAARRLPALIRERKAGAAAVKTETAASSIVPPGGRDAPVCLLHRASTGRRTFARTSVAVADLMRVKQAAGVTVNDVALALVGGALRDYLSARDSLPTRPLLAWVPVGLDGPDAPPRTFGNRVTALTTTFATDVADPWERLITIGAVTTRAKHLLSFGLTVGGPHPFDEWLEVLPPRVLASIVRFSHRRMRRQPDKVAPNSNAVVSHVRCNLPDHLDGAALEEFYITGPPNSGADVVVVLASFSERIFIGVLCVDVAVPEPAELVDGLHRALAELLTLVDGRTAAAAPTERLAVASAAAPARSGNT